MVFDKGQEDFLRLFRYLSRPIVVVAKVELYKPSTSFGSGKIKPDPARVGVVHLVHCQGLP